MVRFLDFPYRERKPGYARRDYQCISKAQFGRSKGVSSLALGQHYCRIDIAGRTDCTRFKIPGWRISDYCSDRYASQRNSDSTSPLSSTPISAAMCWRWQGALPTRAKTLPLARLRPHLLTAQLWAPESRSGASHLSVLPASSSRAEFRDAGDAITSIAAMTHIRT